MTAKAETAETPKTEEQKPEEKSRFKWGFKERTICQMLNDLVKPLPASKIKKRRQGGKEIDYIPWHYATQLFDYYAPGWTYEITKLDNYADGLFIIVRVFIHGSDGTIWREATGYEKIDKDSYGDSASTAESMAIRRAFAKFGLGVELYSDDPPPRQNNQQRTNQPPPPKTDPKPSGKDEQKKASNPGGKNAQTPRMVNEGQLSALEMYAAKVKMSEIEICEKFSGNRKDSAPAETFEQLFFDEAVAAIKWLESQ